MSISGNIAEKILDESQGQTAMEEFIRSRIWKNTKTFHSPIKKIKRVTIVQTNPKSV